MQEGEVDKKGNGYVLRSDPSVRVSSRAHKMSKSRGNVVNPDDVVTMYGADSLRLYEMFMGPIRETKVIYRHILPSNLILPLCYSVRCTGMIVWIILGLLCRVLAIKLGAHRCGVQNLWKECIGSWRDPSDL